MSPIQLQDLMHIAQIFALILRDNDFGLRPHLEYISRLINKAVTDPEDQAKAEEIKQELALAIEQHNPEGYTKLLGLLNELIVHHGGQSQNQNLNPSPFPMNLPRLGSRISKFHMGDSF